MFPHIPTYKAYNGHAQLVLSRLNNPLTSQTTHTNPQQTHHFTLDNAPILLYTNLFDIVSKWSSWKPPFKTLSKQTAIGFLKSKDTIAPRR